MKMRAALTADRELPVPPHFYEGVERVVDMLARAASNRTVSPVKIGPRSKLLV